MNSHKEKKILHCWMGEEEWMEEVYGWQETWKILSEQGKESANGICLLPADHDGPHVWTEDFTITFIGPHGK